MLTPEGAAWLWRRATAGDSWLIVVGDGSQEASAPATVQSIEADDDGATITLSAVFGAADANFEWLRRDVRSADGTVIDRDESDAGRKAVGAEWSVEATIELAGEDGVD